MKKEYKQAELVIRSIDFHDIIVTSNEDPNETPYWQIGGTSSNSDPYSTF